MFFWSKSKEKLERMEKHLSDCIDDVDRLRDELKGRLIRLHPTPEWAEGFIAKTNRRLDKSKKDRDELRQAVMDASGEADIKIAGLAKGTLDMADTNDEFRCRAEEGLRKLEERVEFLLRQDTSAVKVATARHEDGLELKIYDEVVRGK
jgi:hypothetical protein